MEGDIVGEWLRSLRLGHHLQAFLDNGYDDLEVCKQIGDPDLDAIGVQCPRDRDAVLEAVRVLREQGGSTVYFVLEEPRPRDDGASYGDYFYQPPLDISSASPRRDAGEDAKSVYPKLQLMAIVKDRLAQDNVDISKEPYTNKDGLLSAELMAEIAERYAADLKTHFTDVIHVLAELSKQLSHPCHDHTDHPGSQIFYGLFGLYSQIAPRSPPALPARPCLYSFCTEREDREHRSLARSPRSHMNIGTDLSAEYNTASQNGDRKPTYPSSTIGRFLKTLGRPGRKYTYKQYEGDLNARDITMSEDDRIELMVLVKEGKLTMEQAVDTVKQFEYNRRDSYSDSQAGDGNNSEEDLRAYNPKDYTESSSASSSPSHMARSRTSSSVSPAREIPASKSWKSKIPKSPHFFRARFSSPSRQGRRGSASSECSSTSSPREKVKSFFSSPFTRRKATGEAATLSTQGNHKKSDSSLDKFHLPPSGPRGGSTIAQRLRHGSPSRSQSTGDDSSISRVADSSHRNSTGAKCSQVIDEARPPCTRSGRCPVKPVMRSHTFTAFRKFNAVKKVAGETDTLRSRSCDRDLRTGGAKAESSPRQHTLGRHVSSHTVTLARPHSVTITRTELELNNYSYIGYDTLPDSKGTDELNTPSKSPKRHTSPNTTPPHSYTPKRQYVFAAKDQINSTLPKPHFADNCRCSCQQENGQCSTVQRLASENEARNETEASRETEAADETEAGNVCVQEKDSLIEKLSSSSNMSIGSESSGPSNTSQDQRSDGCQGNRYMRPQAETSGDRCNDTSCDNPASAGPCDRQPQFKLRPHRRRSKPRTVEELLSRLSLQHLISVFLHNGYETLDLFSDLEEADLDMLNISNTEDRARILTAAQMLQGYSEVDEPVEKTELCSVSSHSTPSVSSGDSAYYASPPDQLRQLETSSTKDVVYDTNRPGNFARGNGRTPQSADRAPVHVFTNGEWCNGAVAHTSELSNGMPSYRVQVAMPTDRMHVTTFTANNQCHTLGSTANHCFSQSRSNYVNHMVTTCDSDVTYGDSVVYSNSIAHSNGARTQPRTTSVTQCHHVTQPRTSTMTQCHYVTQPRTSTTTQCHYVTQPRTSTMTQCHYVTQLELSNLVEGRSSQRLVKIQGHCPPTNRSPVPNWTVSLPGDSDRGRVTVSTVGHVDSHCDSASTHATDPSSVLPDVAQASETVQSGVRATVMRQWSVSDHTSGQSDWTRPEENSGGNSRALDAGVTAKLQEDGIDLAAPPYSHKTGASGVPTALVQRYAEELHSDLCRVAEVLEAERIKHLLQQGRTVIPNHTLDGSSDVEPVVMATMPVNEFLTVAGLPMYSDSLERGGVSSVEDLRQIDEGDFPKYGVVNQQHVRRLQVALGITKKRLVVQRNPQGVSVVTDKV